MLRDAQAERKVTHTTCFWTVTFPPIHGFLPQIKRSRKKERMRVSPGPQVADQERRRGERACAPKRGKHILIQNKVIAFGIPASNLYLLGNRRSLWGQSVGEGGGMLKRTGRASAPAGPAADLAPCLHGPATPPGRHNSTEVSGDHSAGNFSAPTPARAGRRVWPECARRRGRRRHQLPRFQTLRWQP